MKKILCEIEGTSPLLMHAIGERTLADLSKKSGKKQEIPTPEEEAEDGAYRKKNGELFIPSRCLKASIINASTWYKIGKKSMKQFIAGCVTIEPYEIGLGTKKYEIDIRPVVIGRGNKIMRARPRIDNWKVQFTIIFNEKVITQPEVLEQILQEAGMRIGVLDNRPQKGGENGTFKVVKFQLEK